jgi:heterodisulfide reductase subunit A2
MNPGDMQAEGRVTAPLTPTEPAARRPGRRLGVYVCHCGGNISDHVDVERVLEAVKGEADVVVARDAMFTCSDATQQEIVQDIRDQDLDGLVVASCSPKLHTFTFREAAKRGGLNPYEYTQANIREQCSWTHTDDREGATAKAIKLVRAAIARTRLSEALAPLPVQTTQRALVVGGGITGMRAAIGLADIGLGVFLVEREAELGGWVRGLGKTFPHGANGRELIGRLDDEIKRRPSIKVFTDAELVAKSGTYGNYRSTVRVGGEEIELDVGQIIVATGFDNYQPEVGELGYGTTGVLTLPEMTRLLEDTAGPLEYDGKPVTSIAYIYCVGSRDERHPYCSRYCCNAAVHASLLAAEHDASVRQYHLYRDVRTYGKNELMFTQSRRRGSVFLKFADGEPPEVRHEGDSLLVTLHDLLTGGREVTVAADLVVLVTGMVPRKNDELVAALKLPVGRDGFFNEIHPKLRPVETVVDGVSICGACQGPKTVAESVASGLAAVAQAASVLKRGTVELDPQVAFVHPEACRGCGACLDACPFAAISLVDSDARKLATIDPAACKGCGGCVPVCPEDAIDLRGYTDAQVRAMIDGLLVGARNEA